MNSTFFGECSSLGKRSYLSQWGFKGREAIVVQRERNHD